jgi:hypothetical protein
MRGRDTQSKAVDLPPWASSFFALLALLARTSNDDALVVVGYQALAEEVEALASRNPQEKTHTRL